MEPSVAPSRRPTTAPTLPPTFSPTQGPTYAAYTLDNCPGNDFHTTKGKTVRRLFSGGATAYTGGGYLWYTGLYLNVSCQSNNVTNCYCDTGVGDNVGPTSAPVCCSSKGIAETWRIATTAIPDNYAVRRSHHSA